MFIMIFLPEIVMTLIYNINKTININKAINNINSSFCRQGS